MAHKIWLLIHFGVDLVNFILLCSRTEPLNLQILKMDLKVLGFVKRSEMSRQTKSRLIIKT